MQRGQFLLCEEVCVVGGVDGLSYTKDAMGDWLPPPKLGGVLNIVNPIVLI